MCFVFCFFLQHLRHFFTPARCRWVSPPHWTFISAGHWHISACQEPAGCLKNVHLHTVRTNKRLKNWAIRRPEDIFFFPVQVSELSGRNYPGGAAAAARSSSPPLPACLSAPAARSPLSGLHNATKKKKKHQMATLTTQPGERRAARLTRSDHTRPGTVVWKHR